MNYKLTTKYKEQHFLTVTLTLKVKEKNTIKLQLPAWRPGRYELANFAKNIRNFVVLGDANKPLFFTKLTKDNWEVNCKNQTKVTITYNYYAIDFNAGSTYVDTTVLYVNPINCLLYIPELIEKPCTLSIPIKKSQQIASGLPVKKSVLKAKNFHQLVDNPFIVSSNLQVNSYKIQSTTFYIWFYGECKPNWDKILKDFKTFTQFQINLTGNFPVPAYHFINIIHPYVAYHGVEHQYSTVITLGPSYELMEELYTEFLGISSHELYHTWNIKLLRPTEMHPYDYSKENYTKLGYVAEGITTYMGDLMLYESGVFDKKQYIKEFNTYLAKHFLHDGPLHLSVADSSFDTWLDGYEIGIPDRKSSIYTEGALLSFILDMKIRKVTKNKQSLYTVMQKMITGFALQNKGYTEQDYINTLQKVGNISLTSFFKNYVWGTKPLDTELKKALAYFGFKLKKSFSQKITERLGIRITTSQNETKVRHVKQKSSAYKAGLTRGDTILAINNYPVKNNLNKWLDYFNGDNISLTVLKNEQTYTVPIEKENEHQFFEYKITSNSTIKKRKESK